MIVRDSARTLAAALQSIRPWVDEMVVVDTGSRDDTPRIAQRLGARLYEFAWCDDFSAARNESIRHARGRWLFWMDSDDTIDAANGEQLKRLAGGRHPPDVLGYVVQVRCPRTAAAECKQQAGVGFAGQQIPPAHWPPTLPCDEAHKPGEPPPTPGVGSDIAPPITPPPR